MESGFAELGITYLIDRHLHRTVIDDAKMLDTLHKALAGLARSDKTENSCHRGSKKPSEAVVDCFPLNNHEAY